MPNACFRIAAGRRKSSDVRFGDSRGESLRFSPDARRTRAQGDLMITREDVQAWLDRLELPAESVADDIWLVMK